MSDLASALECLAVGVHFANGGTHKYATTSACYFSENNTIYIASQAPNQTFMSIPMLPESELAKALEQIRQWIPDEHVTAEMRQWKKDVPASGHAVEKVQTYKKARTPISTLWAGACFFAGYNGAQGAKQQALLGALLDSNPAIKIVTNGDIFAQGVSANQGFHGESRLLRYLFIKLLRKEMKGALMNQTVQSPGATTSDFQRRVGGKVTMGSNRVACADCARFMTEAGVSFGSQAKNSSASGHAWVHPFYLDRQTDTVTPVAKEQSGRS